VEAAKGRGAVFRLMLATLEAADPAKAEQVKSGLPTDAVLESVRAGAAGRTRDVTRLAKDFAAYLPCFRQHRKAIEYLITLNQMPNFPDPIVDPAGDIGRFIGAYMRQSMTSPSSTTQCPPPAAMKARGYKQTPMGILGRG